MPGFFVGMLVGVGVSALMSVGVGLWLHRRFVGLERRTREAERLAELGRLTAGLAHEIKNPLSTIQLNLQLLHEDLPPEPVIKPRVHNRLRTVRQEAGRLRDILNDFLRYAGRIELEIEQASVEQIVSDVADFFIPQAAVANVQLRVEHRSPGLTAPVDTNLLKQSLLNLMLNAVQAMPQGGELILRTRREDGSALIDVIDTGPGIDAEKIPQIFEPYFSTKKGGTGLGLPTTRRIMEEHGGEVFVQSEPGRGTIFTLQIPLERRKSSAR